MEETEDKVLLKVKGNIEDRDARKKYLKQLAQAIFMVIQKHGMARLRCVGAAAISNAVKSHIIANGEATKKGVITVSAGGESTLLVNTVGVRISHASIGGGSTLEFIEKGNLPGIEALES